MREAATRGDAAAVRRLAHAFKGSSASLGARTLARMLGELEEGVTGGPAAASLDTIAAELERVRAALLRRREAGLA
jgi:HPt (histidine-containing phosphotransfer) domain-containing protein